MDSSAPPLMDSRPIVLEVHHAAKIFPGNVVAVEDASLEIRRGEVHCLLGANGAGKSTLLKIIAGANSLTRGSMVLDGAPCRFRSPHEAAQAGISMIYQELDLVPQLTVAQNMLLGRVPSRWGLVDHRSRTRIAEAALARVGAHFPPGAMVGSLSIANQQLTAIARSLTMDAKVIIMDEPSAALNEAELVRVFEVIRQVSAQGVAILYVSHRLGEIRAIGDRVTVLRGGRTIDTFDVATTTESALVSAVLGQNQALLERSPRQSDLAQSDLGQPGLGRTGSSEIALEIRSLHGPQGLRIENLQLRRGEILGLSGLNGSGRTTLLRALFGAAVFEGEVLLGRRPYRPRSPAQAIASGVALVPEDRKTQGLVLDSAIYRNAVLPSLRRRRMVTHERMRRTARPALASLSTRFASLEQPVRQLSGGNQQKVVFAKWLIEGSTILLLDEPSRGLDVGAKAELYGLVRNLADAGAAILVASSELDEIYVNCDRIWVLHEGRNIACFDPATASRDEILRAGLVGGEHFPGEAS